MESEAFSYVGFQIVQNNQGITVDQSQYVDSIEEETWQDIKSKSKETMLNEKQQSEYRSMVGSINWCARGTRPDVAYEQIELPTKLKAATVGDYKQAMKCVRKLKENESKIFYPSLAPMSDMSFFVYTDASFANMSDRVSSAMGYVVFAANKDRVCTLEWKSGKIKRVVRSTMAAEALALSEGIGEAMFLQKMATEIKGKTHNKHFLKILFICFYML